MKHYTSIYDFVPARQIGGVSLIVPHAGRFLFGLRRLGQDGAGQTVEITAIGGKRENSDPSLEACAQREAYEEIGCRIRVIPSVETTVIRGPRENQRIKFSEDERPIALIFRHFNTPAHDPWHISGTQPGCVAVFLASLAGNPSPTGELPALIWLRPEQILQTAQQDVRLRDLIATGAQLIDNNSPTLSQRVLVRMTDSQEALALGLSKRTVPFYEDLTHTSEQFIETYDIS